MTITKNSIKIKMNQGGTLLKNELEQCVLRCPKQHFCCYPPLGDFEVKLKLGLLFNCFWYFLFLLFAGLSCHLLTKGTIGIKSIKIFLYTRTVGPKKEKAGRRCNLIWILDKRAFKTLKKKTQGACKTTKTINTQILLLYSICCIKVHRNTSKS